MKESLFISKSMIHSLLKTCSKYPVTTVYIAVAIVLFLAVQVHQIPNKALGEEAFGNALWKLGAVQSLVFVYEDPLIKEDGFSTGGPFDLWAGEWWRILVSGFHHGDLLHLLMNCLAIGFMGRLIEPLLRLRIYASFLILATFISILPEYYLNHYPVGLSGGAFAMFGMLILLRKTNAELAEVFTEREIAWGCGWLILCFVFTKIGWWNIANVAHLAGFLYGLLTGAVLINHSRFVGTFRFLFLVSHLLLIPSTYLICHPVWNGKYYWYLARHEKDLKQRIAYLRKGFELSPGEPKIGAELALNLYRTDTVPFRSWETILQSLNHNRSYDQGVSLARVIWHQFHSDQQKAKALQIANDIFGKEADDWLKRLNLEPVQVSQADVPVMDVRKSLDEKFQLWNENNRQKKRINPQDLSAPSVNPRSPQSAVQGVPL